MVAAGLTRIVTVEESTVPIVAGVMALDGTRRLEVGLEVKEVGRGTSLEVEMNAE